MAVAALGCTRLTLSWLIRNQRRGLSDFPDAPAKTGQWGECAVLFYPRQGTGLAWCWMQPHAPERVLEKHEIAPPEGWSWSFGFALSAKDLERDLHGANEWQGILVFLGDESLAAPFIEHPAHIWPHIDPPKPDTSERTRELPMRLAAEEVGQPTVAIELHPADAPYGYLLAETIAAQTNGALRTAWRETPRPTIWVIGATPHPRKLHDDLVAAGEALRARPNTNDLVDRVGASELRRQLIEERDEQRLAGIGARYAWGGREALNQLDPALRFEEIEGWRDIVDRALGRAAFEGLLANSDNDHPKKPPGVSAPVYARRERYATLRVPSNSDGRWGFLFQQRLSAETTRTLTYSDRSLFSSDDLRIEVPPLHREEAALFWNARLMASRHRKALPVTTSISLPQLWPEALGQDAVATNQISGIAVQGDATGGVAQLLDLADMSPAAWRQTLDMTLALSQPPVVAEHRRRLADQREMWKGTPDVLALLERRGAWSDALFATTPDEQGFDGAMRIPALGFGPDGPASMFTPEQLAELRGAVGAQPAEPITYDLLIRRFLADATPDRLLIVTDAPGDVEPLFREIDAMLAASADEYGHPHWADDAATSRALHWPTPKFAQPKSFPAPKQLAMILPEANPRRQAARLVALQAMNEANNDSSRRMSRRIIEIGGDSILLITWPGEWQNVKEMEDDVAWASLSREKRQQMEMMLDMSISPQGDALRETIRARRATSNSLMGRLVAAGRGHLQRGDAQWREKLDAEMPSLTAQEIVAAEQELLDAVGLWWGMK